MDGAKEVQIHGQTIAIRAKVHVLSGFSAHAGQSELLSWLGAVAEQKPQVILTHGEEDARSALRAKIRQRFGLEATCPLPGDSITLD